MMKSSLLYEVYLFLRGKLRSHSVQVCHPDVGLGIVRLAFRAVDHDLVVLHELRSVCSAWGVRRWTL